MSETNDTNGISRCKYYISTFANKNTIMYIPCDETNDASTRRHQSKYAYVHIYKSLIKYRFFIVCLHLFDLRAEGIYIATTRESASIACGQPLMVSWRSASIELRRKSIRLVSLLIFAKYTKGICVGLNNVVLQNQQR